MGKNQIKLILGDRGEQLYIHLLSLQSRFSHFFPNIIFSTFGRFVFNCSAFLLNNRPYCFLCRLLFALHRLIQWAGELPSDKVNIKIIKVDPAVYGIAIALTSLHEDEFFNEAHIMKGVQNLIPGIKPVLGTYFSYQSDETHLSYLEIKKEEAGPFPLKKGRSSLLSFPLNFSRKSSMYFRRLSFRAMKRICLRIFAA